MLPSAGFGNNARLAHTPRQQALAKRIVDLMSAGMCQIFALEVNLRAAARLAEPRRIGQWCRTTDIAALQPVKLLPERRVVARLLEGRRQVGNRRRECFRDETAAVRAKATWFKRWRHAIDSLQLTTARRYNPHARLAIRMQSLFHHKIGPGTPAAPAL